jgi:glycosyl transferase family 25
MRIYLINLARRPDRLAAMLRRAGGLHLERVEALDAGQEDPQTLGRWFEAGGPLGEIPAGDKACLLSHRRAWQIFVASGEIPCGLPGDDVRLSDSAPALLATATGYRPMPWW